MSSDRNRRFAEEAGRTWLGVPALLLLTWEAESPADKNWLSRTSVRWCVSGVESIQPAEEQRGSFLTGSPQTKCVAGVVLD
jgi:hypothetical protein